MNRAAAGLAMAAGLLNAQPRISLKTGSENPVAGKLSEFRLTTRTPKPGFVDTPPSAWVDLTVMRKGSVADETCRELVKSFQRAGSLMQTAVDLNGLYIVTLDRNGSLSVWNPQGAIGGSRLFARLDLNEAPNAWQIDPQRGFVYVALSSSQTVVSVDTANWKIAGRARIDSVAGALALEPVSGRLAIGAPNFVAILKPGSLEQERLIPVEAQVERVQWLDHRLAVTAGGKVIVHTGDQSTVLPAAKMAAWSAAADAFLILGIGSEVRLLDSRGMALERWPLTQEVADLRMSPDGKLAFIMGKQRNVRVLDLVRRRWLSEIEIQAPGEIAFSRSFVYIRSTSKPGTLIVSADQLRQGFTGGRWIGGDPLPSAHPGGSSIAISPGGVAFWTGGESSQLTGYHEGMNAASGTIRTPGTKPAWILLTGPLLRKAEGNTYEAFIRLPRAGNYVAAASFAGGTDVLCEVIPVQPDPDAPQSQLWRLSRHTIRGELQAGSANKISFQLEGGERSSLPESLSILLMSPDGITQVRTIARRADAGEFAATLRPPLPGAYYLLVRMPDKQDGRPRWEKISVKAENAENPLPKREVQ